MTKPDVHLDDPARLKALEQASLLDTPPEEAFDRYTRLASKLLGVPISAVSLVDKDRQFFKSAVGLPEAWAAVRQTPLSHSFCKHAVLSNEPLIVNDARQHPILKDNAAVPFGVIAYAGIPMVTPDGLVLGSFCAIDTKPHQWTHEQVDLLRDLTASVMTEISLRRANDELRRANAAKDRFIAMLSHDLRTPLSPALLTIAALVADPALPEPLREDARVIQRNLELEVRMIDSLLDLTHITTGKLQLHLGTADLHALVRTSAAMCAADAKAKSIEVHLDLQAGRHNLLGDSTKLTQVFCNLLKNAIKFSPPSRSITVQTSEYREKTVRIAVADQGMGIAPGALSEIFDAFEQGENSIAQRYGGLGLGLAICKGIVEAHGGQISAASEGVGKGATLTVDLPLLDAAAATPEILAAPVLSEQKATLRILLVEDHEDSLRAMSRLLRKLDHRVTTANCVSHALEAADAEDFDLLISDVGLPDGTGLQLMQELLTKRPMKGIALTGYGTESDVQQTRDAGFQKHLTKPISFLDLEEAIRDMA